MAKYQCKKCDYSTDNRHEISQHYRWKHPKRKAGKQPKKQKPTTIAVGPTHHSTAVKYCPVCGTNLHVIQAALEMVENNRGGIV